MLESRQDGDLGNMTKTDNTIAKLSAICGLWHKTSSYLLLNTGLTPVKKNGSTRMRKVSNFIKHAKIPYSWREGIMLAV
jgi:hypothetical protein